jgi:hypothetical protein
MEYQGSWAKNLPWTEFSYNNSYQESLKMAPFELPGEKVIFGPNIVKEAEATVHHIQENLKAVKSCQEICANKRR